MYERFTARASQVMQSAEQEAKLLNHEYIGAEHILLGLLHECDNLVIAVLKNFDLSSLTIRAAVEKLVTPGSVISSASRLPQTPRAEKVIEYAIKEANELYHDHIPAADIQGQASLQAPQTMSQRLVGRAGATTSSPRS